ncbi:MAG: hypothetical protein AABZ40_03625, partial [Thermodesulfobacteriota bacterium]
MTIDLPENPETAPNADFPTTKKNALIEVFLTSKTAWLYRETSPEERISRPATIVRNISETASLC